MAFSILLKVITPDRVVLETKADSIQILLPDGWYGILSGHAPLISRTLTSVLRYKYRDIKRYVAYYQGTVEVQKHDDEPDVVVILTSAAEEGDDLNIVKETLEQREAKLDRLNQEAKVEIMQMRIALENALRAENLQRQSK